ncbi:MAG: ribosomal RNA adenine dimethylase, partial [Bacteroidota bacterium]
MNKIKFFTEGLRNMRTVGTVTPSSRFLCESMLKGIDFSKAKFLVELGAGDGVVTKHILKRMRPDARLLAFEVQPDFCELLRA